MNWLADLIRGAHPAEIVALVLAVCWLIATDVEVAAWCFAVPILALIACGVWHGASWMWSLL